MCHIPPMTMIFYTEEVCGQYDRRELTRKKHGYTLCMSRPFEGTLGYNLFGTHGNNWFKLWRLILRSQARNIYQKQQAAAYPNVTKSIICGFCGYIFETTAQYCYHVAHGNCTCQKMGLLIVVIVDIYLRDMQRLKKNLC